MKTCSVLCYYEGYDVAGHIVCNGNHTCDINYTGYLNAGEYVVNTTEHLLQVTKKNYPTLSRIVLKNVTTFPSR